MSITVATELQTDGINPKAAMAVLDAIRASKRGIIVFGHDDPDIDCMACMIAMGELGEALGVDVQAFYAGQPTHTQNRVFASKFEVSSAVTKLKGPHGKNNAAISGVDKAIVFVDTHCEFGKGNMAQAGELVPADMRGPQIIIDHHSGKGTDGAVSVINSIGSCSTLLFELGKLCGCAFSRKACTALLLGIETDTDFLRKDCTTDRDRIAAEQLRESADPRLYLSVINYSKPKALIDMKGFAYSKENRLEEEGTIVAYAGIVPLENESLISNIADELMNTDNVQTACVIAFVRDDVGAPLMRVSCRTSCDVLDVDELMKTTFGDNFGGRNGNGGGRCRMDSQLMMYASCTETSLETICRGMFRAYAAKFNRKQAELK